MPLDVIMPALGMAQDKGVLLAWHKSPGDPVAEGDPLFEVETDKATMEVEAQGSGFLTDVVAASGDEIPVGQTVARISETAEDTGLASETSKEESAKAEPAPEEPPEPEKPAPDAKPTQALRKPDPSPKRPAVEGRILASPKARRLALERGLDLARLAENGYPQPYHVRDLDTLAQLPETTAPAMAGAAPGRYLSAEVTANGFDEFAEWAAKEAGLGNAGALLAAFAGASLGQPDATVALEAFGKTRLFKVHGRRLGRVVEADDEAGTVPDLRLRDLRFGRLSSLQTGPEQTPVLSVLAAEKGLTLTLECAAEHLDASAAIALLSDFAGRMEQPLRHLL